MKLEYNILWIDNDLQSYIDNGNVASIENFLLDYGFEPNIEKVLDEAELDDVIEKHDYDLIISDYNLENTTGDLIIEKIRTIRQLDTEILFYTAQGTYQDKPEVKERLAFKERLTFQVGRDTLLEKIEKVILLTLKKLLELNATRGLITAATSDLDVEIEKIILLLIEKHNLTEETLKGLVESIVYNPLGDSYTRFWNGYDNFQNYFHKIEAMKKWKILRELLRANNGHPGIAEFLEKNGSYQLEVIEVRNKFAHAKAELIENKMVLRGKIGTEGFQFDNDACIKIRKDLINHKQHIATLYTILSTN